jgi:signal transduction histidine kinase
MTIRILIFNIQSELDVVGARQRARQIATFCGFGRQDQVRIATVVSELARNIYCYAAAGNVHFALEEEANPQILVIGIEDQGPGIANIEQILSGKYQSSTGMGVGITGARCLMDQFEIVTAPGEGTRITLQKWLPREMRRISGKMIGEFCASLATGSTSNNTLTEVLQQNQELVGTLAELESRQEDLLQLTRELEDTNRGVVALYAELDEKAEHLRRADEMKSRFLSNMSHEFRTPLSSIRALATLLLDRVDGDLSHEQEKQVTLIMQSALSLTELVNDLLDLAKIEAGKVDVHTKTVTVADLFSALRGMLRPLLVTESVKLIFEEPDDSLCIDTDEAKLSQILRNFIANALKFTERGEIRVRVNSKAEHGLLVFSVSDTGIGISAEDIPLIFEGFGQVEHPLQRKSKGTGLGLPLCRKLAVLLGGSVSVQSRPGEGSTFFLSLPQQSRQNAQCNSGAVPAGAGFRG